VKICKKCQVNKKNSDYYKGASKCKVCYKAERLEHYYTNKSNPEFIQKHNEQSKVAKQKYRASTKGKQAEYDYNRSDAKKVASTKYKQTVKGEATSRKSHLKTKYNLTIEEWDALYREQDGKCKCCGNLTEAKKMHTDHNHITNKVRGLLCNGCNTGLGQLGDSPSRLQKAYNYLMREGYYGEH